MAYEVYLDNMLLPIPPEKIPIKYPGQNKSATLISGEEINITRPPGLAEISLDVVIPQMDYPCAVWDGSIDDAQDFITRLHDLKESNSPFEFIVIRDGPGRNSFFDTNMDVTLENYNISDDVKEGFDLCVSVSLKEYRHYGTKIMNFLLIEDDKVEITGDANPEREGDPEQGKVYRVVKGDCLWSISKKILGSGSRWPEIHALNKDKVSNPNRIYPGQILTLP